MYNSMNIPSVPSTNYVVYIHICTEFVHRHNDEMYIIISNCGDGGLRLLILKLGTIYYNSGCY